MPGDGVRLLSGTQRVGSTVHMQMLAGGAHPLMATCKAGACIRHRTGAAALLHHIQEDCLLKQPAATQTILVAPSGQ